MATAVTAVAGSSRRPCRADPRENLSFNRCGAKHAFLTEEIDGWAVEPVTRRLVLWSSSRHVAEARGCGLAKGGCHTSMLSRQCLELGVGVIPKFAREVGSSTWQSVARRMASSGMSRGRPAARCCGCRSRDPQGSPGQGVQGLARTNSSATCRLNATLWEQCRAMTSILQKLRQGINPFRPNRPLEGAHSNRMPQIALPATTSDCNTPFVAAALPCRLLRLNRCS
jgi:hypothetical protein